MTQSILIIGTGALACLFAARLSQSGFPITMMGTWIEALAAFKSRGVGLVREGCDTPDFFPVKVINTENSDACFTHAILLTKSYQIRDAMIRALPFMADGAVILSLQNGLIARKELENISAGFKALLGITTCGAEVIQPGVARHNGGSQIKIMKKPEADDLARLFQESGFSVSQEENIDQAIWEKAILNSAVNPVGALSGKRNGELLGLHGIQQVMDDLLSEACLVAEAEGYAVCVDEMKTRLRQVMRETQSNRCSMLQDVLNGRKTEIEAINGEIITRGSLHGIKLPVQTTITNLIRSI